MTTPLALGRVFLLSSALVAPAALAQTPPTSTTTTTQASPPTPESPATPDEAVPGGQDQIDVSIPGADPQAASEIVVRGRFIPNVVRSTPQVVSVLSTADIARTGEGDIAGALTRVTGLSVVGAGFVYVRGLGDRYSLALLNGSPLPSPEPLRRVVPLDIFPTTVVASALVQKSYSANFPAEFGGGVINLTTIAVPDESFLSIGASVGGDTETTAKRGYTYDGGDWDFLGYDDNTREVPDGLADAIDSGAPIVAGPNFTAGQLRDFAASLTNAETTVVQDNLDIPANFSADITGGTSFDIGADGRFGVVATLGFDNGWRTRDARQQRSLDPQLAGLPQTDFRTVITDNNVTVNGLLGLGFEFGEHAVRATGVYIHDTVKQTRLAAGFDRNFIDPVPGQPDSIIQQNTFWFERQLIDAQLVGEFEFGDFGVDLRGTYANTQREAPYERGFIYTYNEQVNDYINQLSGGSSADITFSDLDEDIYSGAASVAYELPTDREITLSAGYDYTKTERTSERREFQFFRPEGSLPLAVAQGRPDFLLSDFNIYSYNIQLRDISTAEGAAAYDAELEVHAGYAQADVEVLDGLEATLGVRYEDAEQTVLPTGVATPTSLSNDYWFPAATITWNFAEDLQLRLHGSKTLARPQFRELAPQLFQDFESDRQFTGNPRLTDSELYNAEGRLEWYPGRDERVSVAGFYKKIEDPIEPVAFLAGGGQLRTGFANAPEAELYGAEVEVQKYFPLDAVAQGGFFGDFLANRRLVLIGNYTYTESELKIDDELVIGPQEQELPANVLFRDGAPLTGQSDHLANLQIGLENTERLSQQTVLLNYASERVTTRGPIQGNARQPDFVEEPGFRLDIVAREGFEIYGRELELKFEARNITGREYEEFQEFEDNRIDINTYDVGTSFSLGLGIAF